ncbi:hypothetical protein SDC9_208568 [bioreactor metagenome]|uniref:Uncharacterized protein n=1 Tax=bioreactor metagenome TaxID=1076179 RepID=A0A645JBL1_9ZZZZ
MMCDMLFKPVSTIYIIIIRYMRVFRRLSANSLDMGLGSIFSKEYNLAIALAKQRLINTVNGRCFTTL